MKTTDDLRRSVLDASIDLIERDGLDALSMREVARMAGVSHQAPYHHFGDREGVLAALSSDGYDIIHAEMKKALAKLTDPVERLEALGMVYVRFAVRHPALFKIMFRSDIVSMEKHCDTKERADTAFTLLASTVEEVMRARGGKDAEALTMAAWALAHGLATLLTEGVLAAKFGPASPEAQGKRALKAFSALLTGAKA